MRQKDFSPLSGKKILITGAKGMLGRAFVEVFAELEGIPVTAMGREELDVTDRAAVLALAEHQFDFIVHCAANVNADYCEDHPEECHQVQVGGTQNICDLAKACAAQVLYPQSFLVFDGRSLPITEETTPNPLSVYGRCKFEAENLLRQQLGDKAIIVRMAGFFGGEEKDKNFVGKFVPHIAKLIDQGVESFPVGDRVWQPSFTVDLARNCALIMASGTSGLYTMSCVGQASFHELASTCVKLLGVDHLIEIPKVSAADVTKTERAKRPDLAFMENRRLKAENLELQRPWQEALAEYLARPYFVDMFKPYQKN